MRGAAGNTSHDNTQRNDGTHEAWRFGAGEIPTFDAVPHAKRIVRNEMNDHCVGAYTTSSQVVAESMRQG